MKRRKARLRRKPTRRKKPVPRTHPTKEAAPTEGPQPQIAVPDLEQLKALSERLDQGELSSGDYQMLRAAFESYLQLRALVRQEGMTAERLCELMRGVPGTPTEAVADEGPNPPMPRKDNRSNGEEA